MDGNKLDGLISQVIALEAIVGTLFAMLPSAQRSMARKAVCDALEKGLAQNIVSHEHTHLLHLALDHAERICRPTNRGDLVEDI